MGRRPLVAALLLPLCLFAPAALAQTNVSPVPHPLLSALADEPSRAPPGALPHFAEQQAQSVLPRGMIGSWDVTEEVRLGLGLIEVVRAGRREPAMRRANPIADVAPRRDRIPAVGLSLRF